MTKYIILDTNNCEFYEAEDKEECETQIRELLSQNSVDDFEMYVEVYEVKRQIDFNISVTLK